jgi:NUMOD4 motif
MTNEHWKDIAGYEGRYQVSDLGRVKSLLRFPEPSEKILAQHPQRGGYLQVGLWRNNKRKPVTVHKLVAHAFVIGFGETINHIDGIKAHNAATNLEWVSQRDNHLHAVRMGLNSQAFPAIRVQDPETKTIYGSMNQAAKTTGIDRRIICRNWYRP